MAVEQIASGLRPLIGAAVLAPSSHNTQPWIFRLAAERISLLADRTRALPVNDPDDRELTISCGAALMNLRVAAAGAGMTVKVALLPDPKDPDLLATLELEGHAGGASEDAALLSAIPDRRTYRKRFAPQAVTDVVLADLTRAAEHEGAWLAVLAAQSERRKVAALVAEGDSIQWANPSWRRELAAWMHPRRKGDGLGVPRVVAPIAQAIVRTFDMGNGVGAKDEQLAEHSPVLAVLGTSGDSPSDWLAAGQSLQRLLLTACKAGLQASYLNQPIQVASLRPKLQSAIAALGFPQLLLRIGYPAGAVDAAPRRALADVIEDELGPS